MPSADITRYGAKQDAQRAALCSALQSSIDAGLPGATSKLWHGIPVWFVGDNPAVGYQARKTGVMLMFWNGRHFDEPELEASGSFHMAQKPYHDASEIDGAKLARWLAKAGESVWDMVGERNAFVAKRRAAKKVAKADGSKRETLAPGSTRKARGKTRNETRAGKKSKPARTPRSAAKKSSKTAMKHRPAKAKAVARPKAKKK